MPSQQIINELQSMRQDLIMYPIVTGTFAQACENYYQHFELMTGEQIGSLQDADYLFNEWNGNEWLNDI